jgi:hypothetical protein
MKSVQALLGHFTLEMTMKLYAKVNGQTNRLALGKLPYSQGALAREGVLPYTATEGNSGTFCRSPATRKGTGTEG